MLIKEKVELMVKENRMLVTKGVGIREKEKKIK